MTKQKQAFYKHGRWLIRCDCGMALPAIDGVICPREYPQMQAKDLKKLPSGLFRPVPAVDLIEAERIRARENGDEYTPVYPPERDEIERITRLRPNFRNLNWDPSETLDDLLIQNIQHGDRVPNINGIQSRLSSKGIEWYPSEWLSNLLSVNSEKEDKNAVPNKS